MTMPPVQPFEQARLVTFDLDGTLYKVRPTNVEALAAYCADFGLPFDERARHSAVRWDYAHWAKNRALIKHDEDHLGAGAFMEKHLRLFVDDLGMAAGDREDFVTYIVGRFQNDFSQESFLEPGTRELLRRLKGAGLRLGLVSNRDQALDDVSVELGIAGHFDFLLAGGEVNSWKPDAAIFRRALEMGGNVAAEEAVHVGDNYYADVVGACGVGISAVLLDEEGAFPEARDVCLVISRLADLLEMVSDDEAGES